MNIDVYFFDNGELIINAQLPKVREILKNDGIELANGTIENLYEENFIIKSLVDIVVMIVNAILSIFK